MPARAATRGSVGVVAYGGDDLGGGLGDKNRWVQIRPCDDRLASRKPGEEEAADECGHGVHTHAKRQSGLQDGVALKDHRREDAAEDEHDEPTYQAREHRLCHCTS